MGQNQINAYKQLKSGLFEFKVVVFKIFLVYLMPLTLDHRTITISVQCNTFANRDSPILNPRTTLKKTLFSQVLYFQILKNDIIMMSL